MSDNQSTSAEPGTPTSTVTNEQARDATQSPPGGHPTSGGWSPTPIRNHAAVKMIMRISGIGAVFVVTAVAWLVLGGIMAERTSSQRGDLYGAVSELWGTPQVQQAPSMTFEYETRRLEKKTEERDGEVTTVTQEVVDHHREEQEPAATQIAVDMALDQRLKGLVWYSLYDVDFDGRWVYLHDSDKSGNLVIRFAFPDQSSLYDDFHFVVDGVDRADELRPEAGQVVWRMPVEPGQRVVLDVNYDSRGLEQWTYRPSQNVASLSNFTFDLTTDFSEIDFPAGTLSPSNKERTEAGGWKLTWDFERIVTGRGVGMVTPQPIQPGELASSLSLSAPISLFFFFLVIFVLATLRKIDIHPLNYVFVAAAFFAFHLLFGYTVDHVHVIWAFALSSAVSIILVVSYIRLVVSSRFAFVETAAAQLIYLVGFSLAHFWDGFTGLTVTVLSILTLFVLMQLTGRIKWTNVFSGRSDGAVVQQASRLGGVPSAS